MAAGGVVALYEQSLARHGFLADPSQRRALGEPAVLVKFLAVVAMEFRGSSEDIGRICHAPTSLSEAMKEAALAVDKRALNI